MRVLQVHNSYQWPGGEDAVFAAESALLRQHGHQVATYEEHNDRIDGMNRLHVAARTVWSRESRARIGELLEDVQPDVCHFHNTFPLVSPSAYYACRSAGVPVVQTLHNYRLICPSATLFRDEGVCEECAGRLAAWPGVVHACYRGSRPASATVALMTTAHRLLGTWRDRVSLYVTPSEFSRTKFIGGGLPADRIVVKPNFLPDDPGVGRHGGGYALFVGRLSPEKGIGLLLQAWRTHGSPCAVKIVGSGPLAPLVASAPAGVEWLGQQSRARVLELMKDAAFLIFPSQWYETFGLTIVEALATGLPVVASRLGVVEELVDHGVTGLLFDPGSPADLAATIAWAAAHPAEMAGIGRRGRQEYEAKYTAGRNYTALLEVYDRAIATC